MMDQVDGYVIIPLAFAALLSGLLLCLVTPWGLARYWWVLVKLVLTLVVIVYSTVGVGVWVEESIAATATGGQESEVAGPLAYGAALNIVEFLFMTWASVAKPWGPTPWTRTPNGRSSTITGRRPYPVQYAGSMTLRSEPVTLRRLSSRTRG